MAYRVVLPPHIQKQISNYHPFLKSRIRAALDSLVKDPFQGKALKQDLLGLYSFRLARYRILYSIHRHILEVHVIAIGHRKIIYSSFD